MLSAPPAFYLKPGQAFFSVKPAIVTTVLGSCLSLTMYHSQRRIGAICHAALPCFALGRRYHRGTPGKLQYVDTSIEWMLDQFEQNGITPRGLEVKMFGGAEMFPASPGSKTAITVGRDNIETALRILKAAGMDLKSWNVGGIKGRKLIFHTHTGEVFKKFVNQGDTEMSLGTLEGKQ